MLREENEIIQEIDRHQAEVEKLKITLVTLCEIYEKNSHSIPIERSINIVSGMKNFHEHWIEALKWAIKADEQSLDRGCD